MGGSNNDGAGVSLAVRLARDARALLDELRSAIQRDSAADAVRTLRTLFDLSEDQVERLSRDMTAQRIGALRYVWQLLAHRCDELGCEDGAGGQHAAGSTRRAARGGQHAEGGHA